MSSWSLLVDMYNYHFTRYGMPINEEQQELLARTMKNASVAVGDRLKFQPQGNFEQQSDYVKALEEFYGRVLGDAVFLNDKQKQSLERQQKSVLNASRFHLKRRQRSQTEHQF